MIVHVITGLSQGGAEAALFRLLAASSNPKDFHVISLSGEGVYGPRLQALGVPVTYLGMRPGRPSLLAFVRLVQLLRRLRPRVVQTWMYHADLFGGVAARLVGVPVCWDIQYSIQSKLSRDAIKRSTIAVVRLCAWLSGTVPARIISCSYRAREAHLEFGYASRFVVIPNCLDLTVFAPVMEGGRIKRAELGIPEHLRVIGHVGRFHPQKDYPTLILAMAVLVRQCSGVRLVLCGKGLEATNRALVAEIERAGLASVVQLLGLRTDVAELMRAMDVFVLSSVGEGFPNVVVEAMASGVPCVVTDVGDVAEIVGDTGWVVPPRDPYALAHGMAAALAESPQDHACRGRAARKRIEDNYDIGRMVVAYRQVWDDVASRGSGR